MKVMLQTDEIRGRKYVTGYWSSSEGIPYPAVFGDRPDWRDEYGNYNWELLPDGSVSPANLAPTQDQMDEKNTQTHMEKAQAVLVRIIVKAVKETAGPAQSWSAIDMALRELLT